MSKKRPPKKKKTKKKARAKPSRPRQPVHRVPPDSSPTERQPTSERSTRAGRPDKRFWPEGEPIPDHYIKVRRDPVACPRCRRIYLDNGGRAVAVLSSPRPKGDGITTAWFRCKVCKKRWELIVKEVEAR